MSATKPTSAERRRVLLVLLLTGIGLVMALWWGVWAFLHNETGVLIITSRPPGAEVILNKRPTNLLTSAFISGLPADSFLVSLRMDGYRPIPPYQGITIQPNETTRVTFLLSPIARGDHRDLPQVSGLALNWSWKIVNINSIPDNAALIIDKKAIGVHTPVTLLLEEGLHHMQAVWPDGSKAYKNILIDPGQSQPAITLRPVTYEKNPPPQSTPESQNK